MATIPTADLPTIRERVAKVNRRAEKLGVEGISLEVGDVIRRVETDPVTGIETVTHEVEVQVVGPVVQVEGWVFLATIDHSEGLIRTSPTHDVDGIRTYAAEANCEHCGHDRQRNTTYVLGRTDDDLATRIQVGSTCIKDFLGHQVSLWVFDAASDLQDDLGGWSGGPSGWTLGSFLRVTAAVIRNHGWVSRGVAREQDRQATADDVIAFFTAKRDDVRDAILPDGVTDEDADLAARAIEWAEGLEDVDNDYLFNVRTVADNGMVTYKSAGIAASIISAFNRAEERRIIREKAAAERSPVPVTDERITIVGTITKVDFKENAYGVRQVITVKADEGFILWGTCPKTLAYANAGDKVRFDAKVEVSDRDETFGFFARPTKAEVLEEAQA